MLNFVNEMNKRIRDNSFVNVSNNNDGAHKHKTKTAKGSRVAFYYYLRPNCNYRIMLNKRWVGQDLGNMLLMLGFSNNYDGQRSEDVHDSLDVHSLNEIQVKTLLSAIDICIAAYKKEMRVYW